MDTKLKEALTSYGGPLSEQQVQTLRDMQGWIEYCISNGLSMKSALGVLAHDVNGILAETPFLLPKVTGYAKYRSETEDLSDMAGSDVNAVERDE
jgi:hypothetical protein